VNTAVNVPVNTANPPDASSNPVLLEDLVDTAPNTAAAANSIPETPDGEQYHNSLRNGATLAFINAANPQWTGYACGQCMAE
jgi:hypothetical protein